jgi:hypothetical protein
MVAGLSIALAGLAGTPAPAGAQAVEGRSFFVVAGLFCLGPGPVGGVLGGVVELEHAHGDIFRFCEAGDPPYGEVFEVPSALSESGGGGTSSPGATCRTASYATVCTLPDGASHVVAIFAVFERPPPVAVLSQVRQIAAALR